MIPSHMQSLGELVKLAASLAPVAGTGSAQNGPAVLRRGYTSCGGVVAWSTSGGVTGGTVLGKLQDSADGSTGWADFADAVTATIPAGPNASGAFEVPVNLRGAKDYVRAVVDSDPAGGTPASIVSASIVLSGAELLPAV